MEDGKECKDDGCCVTGSIRQASSLARLTRRTALMGLLGLPMAAALPRVARADLFGGDIGVLLAQLEQQLQLVSNAISTVQGIMQTVQHLNQVRQHAQTLIAKVKNGGVMGFLDAIKDVADVGRRMTHNLNYVNKVGGAWKDNITSTIQKGDSMSFGDMVKLSSTVNDLNRRMIEDFGDMATAVSAVKDSFSALDSSHKAMMEAQSVDGVVGQVQLLGQQQYALTNIVAHSDLVQSLSARQQAQKYMMDAANEQAAYNYQIQMWSSFGTGFTAPQPADTGIGTDSSWTVNSEATDVDLTP